ncbi:MAG: hypothetical protein K0B08_05710 [Bacteroidales bacterium]|nr:hypothetical protein [Bacteroidales bacterium]
MHAHIKYVDAIFHFSGKWDMPSLCGIQIRKMDNRMLVILTELYEQNPGSSVTGLIGSVAGEVVKHYGIPPETAVFIVHNPERSAHHEFFAETFYFAHMKWDGEKYSYPEWEKTGEESFEF